MARPPGSTDAGTRRRITELLKLGGPATAGSLAEKLGVSDVAVRQHLQALQLDGLVDFQEVAAGRGRPQRPWSLSEAAARVFPDAHAELAVSLLGAMRRSFGEDGLRNLMRARGREQVQAYRRRIPAEAPLRERLEQLAELRSSEGYMAEVTTDADGCLLLIENHCPICAAASACQNLCRAELQIFRRVLGKGIQVECREYILEGARRCTYRVKSKS
jgi:predicted ArsR family transcriptional regulator